MQGYAVQKIPTEKLTKEKFVFIFKYSNQGLFELITGIFNNSFTRRR